VSQNPITRCCRSVPACERCPLRLATPTRAQKERNGRATLVEEILRGSPPALPDSVSDALASLELARRSAQELERNLPQR
jgi:hypothetical protein